LAAPTFLTIGVLLMQDARSDHPFFWPSLMGIVAAANAVAILRINHLHRHAAFTGRVALALRYSCAGMSAGCAMFLVLGWGTGVLPEMVAPMAGDGRRARGGDGAVERGDCRAVRRRLLRACWRAACVDRLLPCAGGGWLADG